MAEIYPPNLLGSFRPVLSVDGASWGSPYRCILPDKSGEHICGGCHSDGLEAASRLPACSCPACWDTFIWCTLVCGSSCQFSFREKQLSRFNKESQGCCKAQVDRQTGSSAAQHGGMVLGAQQPTVVTATMCRPSEEQSGRRQGSRRSAGSGAPDRSGSRQSASYLRHRLRRPISSDDGSSSDSGSGSDDHSRGRGRGAGLSRPDVESGLANGSGAQNGAFANGDHGSGTDSGGGSDSSSERSEDFLRHRLRRKQPWRQPQLHVQTQPGAESTAAGPGVRFVAGTAQGSGSDADATPVHSGGSCSGSAVLPADDGMSCGADRGHQSSSMAGDQCSSSRSIPTTPGVSPMGGDSPTAGRQLSRSRSMPVSPTADGVLSLGADSFSGAGTDSSPSSRRQMPITVARDSLEGMALR